MESSLSLPCITGFVQLSKNTVLKPGFHLIAAIAERKNRHRNDKINKNFDCYDFFSVFCDRYNRCDRTRCGQMETRNSVYSRGKPLLVVSFFRTFDVTLD